MMEGLGSGILKIDLNSFFFFEKDDSLIHKFHFVFIGIKSMIT
jgi:hypothetical protein